MRKPYLPSKHSTEFGMNLPEGMSCGDCWNFEKCSKLCGQITEDRICDWSPSRFVGVKTCGLLQTKNSEN